jgi:hypothetical protein
MHPIIGIPIHAIVLGVYLIPFTVVVRRGDRSKVV